MRTLIATVVTIVITLFCYTLAPANAAIAPEYEENEIFVDADDSNTLENCYITTTTVTASPLAMGATTTAATTTTTRLVKLYDNIEYDIFYGYFNKYNFNSVETRLVAIKVEIDTSLRDGSIIYVKADGKKEWEYVLFIEQATSSANYDFTRTLLAAEKPFYFEGKRYEATNPITASTKAYSASAFVKEAESVYGFNGMDYKVLKTFESVSTNEW